VVARFLGYDLVIQHNVELRPNGLGTAAGGARPPGHWKVPADVVREECTSYCARGKPLHRNNQLQNDTFSVAVRYEWACRGVVEYYLLASNLRDLGWLKWVMKTSLTKTLAAKQQISARQVYRFRLLLGIVPSSVKVYVDLDVLQPWAHLVALKNRAVFDQRPVGSDR
jgi:hypothetical protein